MKGRALVLIQFASLLALLVLPDSGMATPTRALIARSCVVLAMAILVLAFIRLRDSVTVYPEPREGVPFITSGIYSFVRHPMYLAVLLFGAGMAISKWTIANLIVLVILFIDLQIKYRYEDRLLVAKWPEAAEYQQRVGALLPRLRRK